MISVRKTLSVITIGLLTSFLAPAHVATAAGSFATGISGAYSWGIGTGGLSSITLEAIIVNIIDYLVFIISPLSILGIVIGGTLYVISVGNEQRIAQAKRIIIFSLIGLFIVGIRTILTATIYDWLGGVTTAPADILIITNRITGFLQALIGAISTLLLIVGGMMYITSVGDEQKTAKAKQTIFAALAGLFIILIANLLINAVAGIAGTGAIAGPLLGRITNAISYVLSFTAIAAIAAFIYGGFTYLTSGGSDEKLQRGKKIIIYAVIGIVIIMLSAAITNIVISI